VSRRIAVLLLAAGTSSRMAGPNKLLCEVDGITLIGRAMRAAVESRASEVVLVTGWQAERIEAALAAVPASKPVTVLRNADYRAGLASSLRCAMFQLAAPIEAALVQLADMPWITAAHIDRLIEAFDPEQPAIVLPVRGGRRGHPVLWPRRFFAAICDLSGDVGARELLVRHASEVRAVPFDTDAIFEDIDTPEELAGARTGPIATAPTLPAGVGASRDDCRGG
jgi:molybdenum cofactor cytidylyltransferase